MFAETRSAEFKVARLFLCVFEFLSPTVSLCQSKADLVHGLHSELSTNTRITHLQTVCPWKSVRYHFSISLIVITCCMNEFQVPHRHRRFILCRAITPNQFIWRKRKFHINALHNHKFS